MTEAQELAEALHAHLCSANHTDQCGWTYDTWENQKPHSDRPRWLKRAQALMASHGFGAAMAMIVMHAWLGDTLNG